MKPTLGICGIAGAGKDTSALLLQKVLLTRGYLYDRTAFADPLRHVWAGVFDIPPALFHNRDTKEKTITIEMAKAKLRKRFIKQLRVILQQYATRKGVNYTNAVDGIIEDRFGSEEKAFEAMLYVFRDEIEPSSNLLDLITLGYHKSFKMITSPRVIMQKGGTEFFRNFVDRHFWIRIATPGTIITDLRFEEEYNFVKANNGIIIKVVNSSQDDHVLNGHESERYINDLEADYYIYNDGKCMNRLYSKVVSVVDDMTAWKL